MSGVGRALRPRAGGAVRCTALTVAVVALASACSESTPKTAGPTIAVESGAGDWKTWVLSAPDQIEVPPPPAEGSPEAAAEAAEVRALAAQRTPEAVAEAHRWGDYPATEPWTVLNMQLVSEQSKNPPLAARGYALVSAAMADATVAAWHWKQVYRRQAPDVDAVVPPGPDPSYPSEHAALAGAASRVLAYLFPERREATYDETAEAAAASRVTAGTNYRSDVKAGLDLGRAVAEEVIERARHDNSHDSGSVNRPQGVGYWEAPPDNPGDTAAVEPLAGNWVTWVAPAADMVPGPPPAYGSPEFRAQAQEVYDISKALTEEQKASARYWAGGAGTPLPSGIWNQVTLDAVRAAPPVSVARVARVFALVNIAQADAAVGAWATKYKYWNQRPVNAIRNLGIDPTWTPLLRTPVFPSYVSGHSTFSAASAEVLAYLYPGEAERWRRMAAEAGMSRIYGGIHYRADNVDGLRLGADIGTLVVERARDDGADASGKR